MTTNQTLDSGRTDKALATGANLHTEMEMNLHQRNQDARIGSLKTNLEKNSKKSRFYYMCCVLMSIIAFVLLILLIVFISLYAACGNEHSGAVIFSGDQTFSSSSEKAG